jgi:hypothetical protein
VAATDGRADRRSGHAGATFGPQAFPNSLPRDVKTITFATSNDKAIKGPPAHFACGVWARCRLSTLLKRSGVRARLSDRTLRVGVQARASALAGNGRCPCLAVRGTTFASSSLRPVRPRCTESEVCLDASPYRSRSL